MRQLQTEVLVIGGGATGTGIVRDLAMRGFKTVLVERRDLTDGTTGRYHGLLHSGGRYAVKDPQAARECIEENQILRRIMPHCIEDTGGFFVQTPGDDPGYADRFISGCAQAGISCEEVPIAQMLREEPLLDPRITRCFRVPDGSADSFLAADLNAASARQHGAEILRYHPVQRLLRTPGCITGALCHDLVKDEDVEILADLVINAAGAWAGKIAATAAIPVTMTPGKGVMIALNHRVVNTVINRCKMPGDGDILVPAHTVAVIGTTDTKVPDPDHFGVEPWEVELMLAEGEKLIPAFRQLRLLRAWAGVRPLYKETEEKTALAAETGNRDITRAFVLLDHGARDGVEGLLTITSGKWTTYRKMAEVTVDKVCEKLNTRRECRTHLEMLPLPGGQTATEKGSPGGHPPSLGHRLAEIEHESAYGQLMCECELATQADVSRSILENHAETLDDIRRDVRLGMGPCQGGFCTLRAVGLLHRLRHPAVEQTNLALRDFLQERWKGILPVLWGQQMRQERLDELIYLDLLNIDHLPGPKDGRLSPVDYEMPAGNGQQKIEKALQGKGPDAGQRPPAPTQVMHPHTIVIGAGLAGLTAAWRAAANGKKVKVIAKGWGANHWGSGCIDVLGYYPFDRWKPVTSPTEEIEGFLRDHPRHPYALAGVDTLYTALRAFQNLCAEAGYPLHGSPDRNYLLPVASGAIRPTCLAPETMIAGDLHSHEPLLVVGFEQFLDFYPSLVTDNLNAQYIFASEVMLDIPSLRSRKFVSGMVLARLFDTAEFRAEVVKALKPRLSNAQRVGFPAVLGLRKALEAQRDLQEQLGVPVFEIAGLPPSVPGIRLHNLLIAAIEKLGGRVYEGMLVSGSAQEAGKLTQIFTEAATRQAAHRAEEFILATGGILGGGIATDEHGAVRETALGLALHLPGERSAERSAWFQQKFLAPQGHPFYQAGIPTGADFRPITPEGQPLYENLFAAGGILPHADPLRERSLEGIALATGYAVGEKA